MLRVHLADGRTLHFDLKDERQAAEWLERVKDHAFQASLRGVTVQHNGAQYSVARPSGFGRVWMFAEALPPDPASKFKGGERATVQADEVRAVVMVHDAQRAARVSLSKTGQQCYNPVEWRR